MILQMVLWLKSGDRRIFQWLNNRLRCTFLNRWMPKITHLGGASFSFVLFVILYSLNVVENKVIVEGSISLITSHLLVQLIKKGFCRRRPYLREKFVYTVDRPLQDYSFPSGHSTAIFSWSSSISFAFPLLSPFLYFLAMCVGLSRIYLGHHYPVDVGVGALIGISFAGMTHFLLGSG